MAQFAIIPATPVLLPEVDLIEQPRIAQLRATVHEVLAGAASWSLPVDSLPPLVGLGGWGIDRGIDTRTGELLDGSDWVDAVNDLSAADLAECETAHPAIAVAALHAHAAGVSVGARGSSDDVLIPVDLSGASRENSPLAPIDGALEYDDRIVSALTGNDCDGLAALLPGDGSMRADLRLLASAIDGIDREDGRAPVLTEVRFDETVHEVRSLCAVGTC